MFGLQGLRIGTKEDTMDYSSDDYLATLGGSLMKDLLADLQVDDNDWSLEQLESELAQLDHVQQPQVQANPVLSAASLVVSHAQERAPGLQGMVQPAHTQPGMDAWSLSLEKFTALSLEQDFLAADTVRKQQQNVMQQPPLPAPPAVSLEGAEDYDVVAKPTLAPPPGLGGGFQGMLQNQLIKPEDLMATSQDIPSVPPSQRFPKTPQNSVVISQEVSGGVNSQGAGVGPLAEKIGPALQAIEQQERERGQAPQQPSQQGLGQVPKPPGGATTPQPLAQGFQPQQPGMHHPQGIMPLPPGVMPPQPFGGVVPPPMHPPMHHAVQAPVVAVPAVGRAWQRPMPPPPMPQPLRVYCNPHPSAPPIPAAALESRMMKSRDIAYVIHSILKPVLAEGVSDNDYDIQFLKRIGGRHLNPANPKHTKDVQGEMQSRTNKSKEWSSEKGVLGLVAKTNVARPRALIAAPVSSSEQDTEQKHRASLWKARIYCDQAYQSYHAIVDIWKSAPPGAVPPQVQFHLMKLMKCLGVSLVDKEYKVDAEGLKLVLKLGKGRILVARVLEQALLPPNAVQALLPATLSVLLLSPARKNEDSADDRVFRAMAHVIPRVNLPTSTVLESVQVVLANRKAAISSTARMECLHALLQKGSMLFSQDPSADLKAEWSRAENEFMSFLQGV